MQDMRDLHEQGFVTASYMEDLETRVRNGQELWFNKPNKRARRKGAAKLVKRLNKERARA